MTSIPAPNPAPTSVPVTGPQAQFPGLLPEQRTYPFTWRGSPWELTGVCFLNMALLLLTVGIYGFWGRTEIRRRTWSSVRLLGEPLAYHGTPQELLKGFMAVLFVVLMPLFLAGAAVVIIFGQQSAVFGFYQVGLFLCLYPILTAIAYYRARRYRLGRTSWRGIRGSMKGSSSSYAFLSWATACAYPLTLGWIGPYRAIALQRRLVSETTLGNRPLTFSGTAKSLYGRYALLWFGTIILYVAAFGIASTIIGRKFNPAVPASIILLTARDWAIIAATLFTAIFIWSLMSSFYYAKLYNHVAQSTTISAPQSHAPVPPLQSLAALNQPAPAASSDGTARFDLDVRGRRIIYLFVTNALITYLSLYILKPVATARSMKYFTEHLSIVGPFDPAMIGQNTALIDQSGEGLAQAFDLDAF